MKKKSISFYILLWFVCFFRAINSDYAIKTHQARTKHDVHSIRLRLMWKVVAELVRIEDVKNTLKFQCKQAGSWEHDRTELNRHAYSISDGLSKHIRRPKPASGRRGPLAPRSSSRVNIHTLLRCIMGLKLNFGSFSLDGFHLEVFREPV